LLRIFRLRALDSAGYYAMLGSQEPEREDLRTEVPPTPTGAADSVGGVFWRAADRSFLFL